MELDALGLKLRTYNALRRGGIETVEQLRRMTREQLAGIRGLGPVGCQEIEDRLQEWECRRHRGG